MLKKDSVVFGILIGLLVPAVLFGILLGIDSLTGHSLTGSSLGFSVKKMMFVCCALNILPIRYYFVNSDGGNTGKGILVITVIEILFITILK
jgi:hypothetical protein